MMVGVWTLTCIEMKVLNAGDLQADNRLVDGMVRVKSRRIFLRQNILRTVLIALNLKDKEISANL